MTPKQLRALRKRLGLTQGQLAAKIGVREHTVYRWEAGIHPIMPHTEAVIRMVQKDTKK